MHDRLDKLAARLSALDADLRRLKLPNAARVLPVIERWHTDSAATLFHLADRHDHPTLLAVLGGTGTGKSTLVNRLLGSDVSAASFRRTFTAGAVAIAANSAAIPRNWLNLPHEPSAALPARGEAGKLLVVQADALDSSNSPGRDLLGSITLIDTPDLDGDQPAHHAEADRVFRWAQALVFIVTPEKYQMTELLPYYRLARRYALPTAFVMNKCQEQAALEDFAAQLAQRDWPEPAVFAVPRDDAAYEPPPGADLAALRSAITQISQHIGSDENAAARGQALRSRLADLLDRLRDQVIAPLREQRRQVDGLKLALRAIDAPPAGLDISPVTQQLQRRLQEQSILYLMGPQRILDRVRQVPGLLLRLPRTAWDLVMRGESAKLDAPTRPDGPNTLPDFPAILADQFAVFQSRLADLLTSTPLPQNPPKASSTTQDSALSTQDSTASTQHSALSTQDSAAFPLLPRSDAASIAQEELADLKRWLEERWHATPRDTAMLQRLLKHLPGGKALGKWSEAAPYLLAIIVATHHAFFGPVDLLILGSFSLATWLGEKLSNEVASRTRHANRRIAERYEELVQKQIIELCAWLEEQSPPATALDQLERSADAIQSA